MYVQNIIKAIKTMSNEMKDFIFENYHKQIEFSKKISYNSIKHLTKKDLLSLTNKLIKNILDPCKKKKQKMSKKIRNDYLSTKKFSRLKHC